MVEGGYGATVGETGPEKPDVLIVPAARIYDLVPVRELPYGPAAPSLHQRPDRWQHPTTCQPSSKNRLHLAGRPQMSTRPDPGRRIWILLTLYSADCRSQETAAFEFVPRSCQGVRRGRCHRRIDGVDCGIARGLVAVVIQCALGCSRTSAVASSSPTGRGWLSSHRAATVGSIPIFFHHAASSPQRWTSR